MEPEASERSVRWISFAEHLRFMQPFRSIIVLPAFLYLASAALAQSTTSNGSEDARPFVFGAVQQLRSTVLGQDRTLNIYLPDGYAKDSSDTYPVIYVLDGSANEDFPHIAGLAQFMNMYTLLPKSIVVGIANVDRGHDFTHATSADSDKVWVPKPQKFPSFSPSKHTAHDSFSPFSNLLFSR